MTVERKKDEEEEFNTYSLNRSYLSIVWASPLSAWVGLASLTSLAPSPQNACLA